MRKRQRQTVTHKNRHKDTDKNTRNELHNSVNLSRVEDRNGHKETTTQGDKRTDRTPVRRTLAEIKQERHTHAARHTPGCRGPEGAAPISSPRHSSGCDKAVTNHSNGKLSDRKSPHPPLGGSGLSWTGMKRWEKNKSNMRLDHRHSRKLKIENSKSIEIKHKLTPSSHHVLIP